MYIKLLTAVLLINSVIYGQNIGIGTTVPTEKLEVNGAVKIGNTNTSSAGTIRWNPANNDFEGYDGVKWVSLTFSKQPWGTANSIENYFPYIQLNAGDFSKGTALGSSLDGNDQYILSGAVVDYQAGYGHAGSVRILKKTGNIWYPYYTLFSPHPNNLAYFGNSVAISGNTIICSMPNYAQGRAYIFSIAENNGVPVVTQQALLTDVSGQSGDFIGSSVDITNEYAAVGASHSGNQETGKVYTYKKSSGLWLQMQHLVAPDASANSYFGNKVSLSGQYLAVGSPHANVNSAERKGKVYIYRVNQAQTGWDYITSLWPPDSDDSTYFGYSVYLQGDTLLVGAPGYSLMSDKVGKAYLYIKSGNSWTLQTTFITPSQLMNDEFGNSVHFKNNKIIIGARYARFGEIRQRGKAYVYTYNGQEWSLQATLISSDGEEFDYFGTAVLISDSEAVVGSPGATLMRPDGYDLQDNGKIYFYRQ